MELEVFDGWTIDKRLKQLRKVRESNDKILFVDFDSELGDLIFQKKLVIDELNDFEMELTKAKEEKWSKYQILDTISDIESAKSYLGRINEIIKKLEKELI